MQDTFMIRVAGTSYRQREVEQVEIGDPIRLELEPDNKYDPNAIKVMSSNKLLGYVPRDKNESIGIAIREDYKIAAKVAGRQKPAGSDFFGVLVEMVVTYKD